MKKSNKFTCQPLLVRVVLASIIVFLTNVSMVTQANAVTTTTVGISTSYEERRGATTTVSLYIESAEKVGAGSLDIYYNDSKVTVRNVKKSDTLDDVFYSINDAGDGNIKLAWASAYEQEMTGTLLEIEFRLSKADVDVPLEIKNVQLVDEMGQPIAVQSHDGKITPFSGKNQAASARVNAQKSWTVDLNQSVNLATLNRHNVYVIDRRGERVPTAIRPSSDRQSFEIYPLSTYDTGDFILVITEQVRTPNGDKLKEPIQFEFTVE